MAVNLICVRNSIRLIYPIWNTMQCLRLGSKNKDSMENFISDLTARKLNKWNELRKEAINRNQSQSVEIASSDEQKHLIDEIHSCLDTHDDEMLETLIRKYLHNFTGSAALPRIILLEVLEYMCREGNKEIYQLLINHIKMINLEFYNDHKTYFDVLDLELCWKTGQNVDEVLKLFEMKYLQNLDKSKRILLRKFCLVMINDTISRKGESVVIKLKESIERICEQSRDYQMMFDLWRKLFESFWFSDQQIASELIAKHRILREKLVSKQLSFLCFIYLRSNNTENVNRLIQIFLQFNMMKQVETLVKILFEYECWNKNLDAVLQIVELCLKLDIALNDVENKKFLNLMLKQPTTKKTEKKTTIKIEKYQFKF